MGDLEPGQKDVLRADFLAVRFGGLEIEDGCLHSLPERSFHGVLLSMVLSYLPTVDMRLEMLRKARHCLVDDGLLLLIESPGICGCGKGRSIAAREALDRW